MAGSHGDNLSLFLSIATTARQDGNGGVAGLKTAGCQRNQLMKDFEDDGETRQRRRHGRTSVQQSVKIVMIVKPQ
jgi:hypothetical protein